jgi:pyrroline-5-carboxylate reductase
MNHLEGCYGFLGCGNMGTAILSGVIEKGILSADAVRVYDPAQARSDAVAALGVKGVASAAELAAACDTLVLAVKPQSLDEAVAPLLGKTKPDIRVISIMAGISIAALRQPFGNQARILRVMPNTPALVGAGAAAMAACEMCGENDIEACKALFGAVGIIETVPEQCIDAVTALSGSGPAYYFYLTECLITAAMAEGLPQAQAERLAAQTLTGAGKLLAASNQSPAALREQVTSKGGTTFAALETMRARGLEGVIREAVHAAAERSRELGK